MWIIRPDQWAPRVTPLEKFFMERVIQRCDNYESITNQHRTTNGYIQLKEMISLGALSSSRGKTIRSLKVLIEEAKSNHFSQNIANDLIIGEYFKDLKEYIVNYNTSKLAVDSGGANLSELYSFIHKLKIFEAQLDDGYFSALLREIKTIEYKETKHVHRNAKQITILVDILLPYLVFKGYGISALSEIMKSWVDKKYHTTFNKIAPYFNFYKRKYEYAIVVNHNLKEHLEGVLGFISNDFGKEIKSSTVKNIEGNFELTTNFTQDDEVILYQHDDLDPHAHFRTLYDKLLKGFVQAKDRDSLAVFNSFFDLCYWRLPKKGKNFHQIAIHNDPLNVKTRNRTLYKTIQSCCETFNYKFSDGDNIPISKNEQVSNSLYYYNLALGSKSIENSLSLLWTSLEALLPYRTHFSDIECVQSFVSKSLSIGAISRDVYHFSKRLIAVNDANNNAFNGLGIEEFRQENLIRQVEYCYKWMTNKEGIPSRFDLIKEHSELLAFEYSRIARPIIDGKIEVLAKRLLISNKSIEYQLQRIYVHRNQIIHSGNLVNEYTNLWVHLEWYIGKLLAYPIIIFELTGNKLSLADLFIDVEADYEYLVSYLTKNSDVQAIDMSERIQKILFKYAWQV